MECAWPGRWEDIDKVLLRSGPFARPGFEPCEELKSFVQNDLRILVIGAGGLGCEILKNLALSGFRRVDVIDMDTIELSNLNRQFLFRKSDIGSNKCDVAARFVNERVPGADIVPHFARIEDKDEEFYRQFKIIVSGLDSIPARRWINGLLCSMVQVDAEGQVDLSTVIPLIDGGTEGLKGHIRVILPGVTACFECSIEAFAPRERYPICTVAETPRLPEHCIEWARVFRWPAFFPEIGFDGDNPEHVKWIYEVARKRAETFSIQGVTLMLTKGVVKNILPAIAATNAIVAAACCNEVVKVATNCLPYLSNYMMFNAAEGFYSLTFEHERNPECFVCQGAPVRLEIAPTMKLEEVYALLLQSQRFQLKKPSLRCQGKSLYMASPPVLEIETKPNLCLPMKDLVEDGDTIDVTDPTLAVPMALWIVFQ